MLTEPVVPTHTASPRPAAKRSRLSKIVLRAAAGLLLAASSGAALAQPISEGFDDITLLTGSGWFLQNNSTPVGSTSWFQGTATTATPTPGPFNSFNGAANSYIGANFNNTGSTGTISNWLIMPNRTLRNGDVLTFYTRKPTIGAGQTDYPDRLEVRYSTNGASTNVGSGAAGTGDFTTLVLSVNPTLVANVYPQVWTQYTVTVSGLPAPTSGRFAFRYFVSGAGSLGSNSDYIGIDQVNYTPYVCPAFTMTPGGALAGGTFGQAYSTSLTQTGALGAPNYAITAGSLPSGLTLSASGTISGTPTGTGVSNFTVTVADNSGCSGSQAYSITVAAAVPSEPQSVSAVAGDTVVDVSWVDSLSDGGSSITGYVATCSDGANDFSAPSSLVSPITVTGLTNGTPYTCTVVATNGIGDSVASAPSNSVTPTGDQTITFDPQSPQTYSPGGTFEISPLATASSGLEVTYDSATPGICTVSGTTVTILAVGTCTLTADQAGDAAWNAAPQVTQNVDIGQADQVLTFPAQTVPEREFELNGTFAIDPEATSSTLNSGQPIVYSSLDTAVCTVSGTTVTMLAEGTCQLAADQAGDANYTAAAQAVSEVVLATPTQADLSITKTANVTRAQIGDTVTYTIVVSNAGPADATDVQVLDLAPERLGSVVWECVDAVGTVCPTPASDIGDLDVTVSLPEGATVQFEVIGTVVAAADPEDDYTAFDNTAVVALAPGSELTDPDTANNESTASVDVISEEIFADGFETVLLPE